MEIVQAILLFAICVFLVLIYGELQKGGVVLRRSAEEELSAKDYRESLLEYKNRGLPIYRGAPISLPVRMTPSEFAEASREENIRMKREEAKKNAS